jgi:outer membrane receptor protein involved in Fe transport
MKNSDYRTKIILSILQVCFVISVSLSQTKFVKIPTGTIKGTIVDSVTKRGIGYVTLTVHEEGSADVIKGVFSSEQGSFEITGVPYKQLQLTITSVGYREKTVRLPTFTSSIIFVGKLPLASSANHLQEVKVVAEKLLVQQDVDKLTYNVSADPESKTVSALEMLRKVPLVTIDADDDIKLSGSGSYKVLINGRTSALFANKVSDVFKGMPASSIKSIEIITSPPAKYEAEGVGGIINIITYKKSIDGYNGSVNIGAAIPARFNTGGYLTAKAGKVGFSNTFGYNLSTNPTSTSSFLREDKLYSNNLSQAGESNSKNSFGYVASDVSYELSATDLLTANLNINTSSGSNNFNRNVQLLNGKDSVLKAYKNINESKNKWAGYDYGLDYQHTFKNNIDRLLTLSYRLENNSNASNTKFSIDPLINYKAQQNISDNDGTFTEETLQADYVQPIKKQTLEMGVKSITRTSASNYSYKNQAAGNGGYVIDSSLSNNFDYTQNIYGGYISLTVKKNNWGFKAGTRLEDSKINANFKSSQTFATQEYFNLIPNLSLSRKLKRTSSLRLSYTQRIERPSLYYLDPFVDISDPKNIYFGNPKLHPAISNVFNFGFITFMKGSSVNLNLFHHFTNNSILRYTTLGKDSIARTTFGNIGRDKTFGLSLSSNITLHKNLSINVNSTTSYQKFTAIINGGPQINDGLMFNASAYVTYRFNKGWRTSASVNYNSSSVLLQGRQAGYVSNTVTINKEFLKDKKGTISFTASNPWQEKRKSYTEVNDPAFYQLQTSYFIVRRFSISFNYRFGKLQEDIARKKRGIKNDDLKTSQQTDTSN